jgi:4-diphosphocytidyl-2-C-methyl-D-erythritol kinase
VVKPAAGIVTADIFASPQLVRDTPAVILSGSFAGAEQPATQVSGFGRNDLQPIAEARCPEVQAVARWLDGRYGNSRMSGSGSAVFARVGAHDDSTWRVNELPASWVGRMCRSLTHHPLKGWVG